MSLVTIMSATDEERLGFISPQKEYLVGGYSLQWSWEKKEGKMASLSSQICLI